MTESASPMHQGIASEPQTSGTTRCRACPALFTPKKSWQHFCGPRCRNSWHNWTRPEAVREARELVRLVLAGEGEPKDWNPRARKLLGVK